MISVIANVNLPLPVADTCPACSAGTGDSRWLLLAEKCLLSVVIREKPCPQRNLKCNKDIPETAGKFGSFGKNILNIFQSKVYQLYATFMSTSCHNRLKSHIFVTNFFRSVQTRALRILTPNDTYDMKLPFLPTRKQPSSKFQATRSAAIFAAIIALFFVAASDDARYDDFTRKQLHAFQESCDRIALHVKTPFLRHALNTGGIERFPDAAMDMVRLGIGLYGVSAGGHDQQHLQTPGKWKTIISQIKHIKGGESVGYSRSFVAPFDMTIATIPVGYADGLRRTMSNGQGYVMVRGEKAPIVGNVCMDMTMIDVSAAHCSEGDEVELFGEHISLLEFARMCNTIPYEVLTSVSQRVKRVYGEE